MAISYRFPCRPFHWLLKGCTFIFSLVFRLLINRQAKQMAVAHFIFVLFFATSVFAQFGVMMQKPFPESTPSSPVNPVKGIPLDGTKLYAFNFSGNAYISLDLPGYTNMTSLVPSSSFAGGVDFDDAGDLYAIRANAPTLYKIDFDTLTITTLGTVSGLPSQWLVGLAYDSQTKTMYCLQSDWGTSGSIYTINLTTLTATLIGTITGMTHGEALAFNSRDRMLYAFDFKPDRSDLLKIDPATASATVVGSTTAFLNYSGGWFGDCDFNDVTGELIYSTYNNGPNTASIWSIDASNCSATLANTVSNAQFVLAINTKASPVPALSSWGLAIFVVLIVGSAVLASRRRRRVRIG